MTLAYWCVLAAALLPYPYTLLAKTRRDYDNRSPRAYLETVVGWRRRAHWAQLNSFEAFPPFAAAVIIAHQSGAAQATVNALALGFLGARLAHGLCYLADRATLRSLAWLAAWACVIALFITAA